MEGLSLERIGVPEQLRLGLGGIVVDKFVPSIDTSMDRHQWRCTISYCGIKRSGSILLITGNDGEIRGVVGGVGVDGRADNNTNGVGGVINAA